MSNEPLGCGLFDRLSRCTIDSPLDFFSSCFSGLLANDPCKIPGILARPGHIGPIRRLLKLRGGKTQSDRLCGFDGDSGWTPGEPGGGGGASGNRHDGDMLQGPIVAKHLPSGPEPGVRLLRPVPFLRLDLQQRAAPAQLHSSPRNVSSFVSEDIESDRITPLQFWCVPSVFLHQLMWLWASGSCFS